MKYLRDTLRPAPLLALLSIICIDILYVLHERLISTPGILILLLATLCYCALFFLLRKLQIRLRYTWLILAILIVLVTIAFFAMLYLGTETDITSLALLTLSGNILRGYLVYSWLTLISIYIGARLLKTTPDSQEEALGSYLNQLGVGLAAIMLLYYVLNLLQLLWLGPWLLSILTLVALWSYSGNIYQQALAPRIISLQKKASLTLSNCIWITIGASGVLLMFSTFTYQYFDPDDMRQYISVPLLFLQHGGYVPFSLDILNQVPQLGTYLIIPLLQLGGAATSMLNGYFLLATLLVWIMIGKRTLSPKWLLVFAALLLAAPLNFSIYGIRPDGALVFLISLACYNLLGESRRFFLAGIFTGIAIGIKYNAFLALPALAIIILASTGLRWRSLLRAGSLFAGGALLAALPWLTFNLVTYGNLIHPVQLFSPSINALTSYETNVTPRITQYLAELELRSYRFNRYTPFIEKMLRVSVIPEGWIINHVGPLLLLAFLLLLWARPTRRTVMLAAASLASLLVWHFLQVNQMHYVLFLMPVLALIVASQLMTARARLAGFILPIIMAAQFVVYTELPMRTVHAAHELTNDPVYEQAFANTGLNILSIETATALNNLEKEDPNYIAMLFDRADVPLIHDSYRHIEYNFAATSWFSITADDPTAAIITARLNARHIDYLVVPNRRPLYNESECYIDGCPITKHMYQGLDVYVATLEKEYTGSTVTIYTVPRDTQNKS